MDNGSFETVGSKTLYFKNVKLNADYSIHVPLNSENIKIELPKINLTKQII